MIVRYFDVGGSVVPVEDDAVLLVDGNGPMALTIASEPMESCPGVVSQVVLRGNRVKNIEPTFDMGLDALETAHPPVKPNGLRILVRK